MHEVDGTCVRILISQNNIPVKYASLDGQTQKNSASHINDDIHHTLHDGG